MKKYAGTLFLFAIAVGLGVWLWLDRHNVTVSERKRRENNVFVAWRKEDIARIEIAHGGGAASAETIVLERDPKKTRRGGS